MSKSEKTKIIFFLLLKKNQEYGIFKRQRKMVIRQMCFFCHFLKKNGVQTFLSFFLDKNSCSPKKLRRFWKKQVGYHFMLLNKIQKIEKIEKIEKKVRRFF